MPDADVIQIPRQIDPHPHGSWIGEKPRPNLLALYDGEGRLFTLFDGERELDLIIPPGNGPITADDIAQAALVDPYEDDLSEDGHTYFIGGDIGAIKIGCSVNVQVRLKDIQACSPIPVRILALRAGRRRERLYHRRFAAHRLHGEWFSPAPEILAEIERLNTPALSVDQPCFGREG